MVAIHRTRLTDLSVERALLISPLARRRIDEATLARHARGRFVEDV